MLWQGESVGCQYILPACSPSLVKQRGIQAEKCLQESLPNLFPSHWLKERTSEQPGRSIKGHVVPKTGSSLHFTGGQTTAPVCPKQMGSDNWEPGKKTKGGGESRVEREKSLSDGTEWGEIKASKDLCCATVFTQHRGQRTGVSGEVMGLCGETPLKGEREPHLLQDYCQETDGSQKQFHPHLPPLFSPGTLLSSPAPPNSLEKTHTALGITIFSIWVSATVFLPCEFHYQSSWLVDRRWFGAF